MPRSAPASLLAAAAAEDPVIARHREERRREAPPAAILPVQGDPLPSYEPREGSPPLPKAPGIRLAAPRLTVLGGKRPSCVLRGRFRLPVRDVDRVDRPGGARLPPGAERLATRPTAVVPISLLLIGSVSVAPLVWRLGVPTFEPIGDGGLATGFSAQPSGPRHHAGERLLPVDLPARRPGPRAWRDSAIEWRAWLTAASRIALHLSEPIRI